MVEKVRRNKANAMHNRASGGSIPLLIKFIAEVIFNVGFEKSLLHRSPPMYMRWPEAEDESAWEKTKINVQ